MVDYQTGFEKGAGAGFEKALGDRPPLVKKEASTQTVQTGTAGEKTDTPFGTEPAPIPKLSQRAARILALPPAELGW